MMKNKSECAQLSPCALGLAFGITNGLFMMLFAWAGMFGFGVALIDVIGSVFYGYAPTFLGGIIGGVWGLIDGFVFGFVAGWIYNGSLGCCCKFCSKK
ncbi:MAG: hypothetical protein ACD_46C00523G0004 [uncultured bacterium]|nr:MAG: hypothetical protein ACD_46C00523G0004 [uncultured bacterium]